MPTIAYPPELPITARKDDVLAALRDHQVVIVAGETGSGKSTQLPKICLELGRGVDRLVGHTQPRRLAARTVAERVAEELETPLGAVVGYTVRFTDRVAAGTRVKVMTDGILLTEIHRDRRLARYDTLIVDEAHERSLNIDFVLGYVKRLLPRRPDLKLVVTSATIDTERFSRHFGDAPVIEVSGRTYPVAIRYRPFGVEPGDDRDQAESICDAVVELFAEGPGDVLAFVSGEREIRDTAEALERVVPPGTEIVPLYARLSAAEQHRVFRPHRQRRVVVATNVAETSLTVPGIRYVVDAGTARISRYSRRTKVQRLPIEPVSQASADQRAGRCGRIGPGICVRLYSEDDLRARPAFTEPEILRTNLASVILQMTALDLGEVGAFPFVDPPDARNVQDAVTLLEELGALGPAGKGGQLRLTAVGRKLARLPLDPRLGRMVLEADPHGCVAQVMVIAAGLSIQDPRERPAGREQAADELHARFADPDSDFLAYLNLWDHLQAQQDGRSSGQFRRLCRAEFLNYLRVREWQDIYGQLRQAARSIGVSSERGPADAARIHRSLLAGLLSHVGMWDAGRKEYEGPRNARFAIAPGSALFRKSPRWVMAAELVETTRLWARVVARIQPEWAESAGRHLVRRSYREPRWDPSRGMVVADERVTLYGLPVVASRRVDYGGIDPAAARALFIRHALVERDWRTGHAFFAHHRKLIEEVRGWQDRARRHDLLVDEDTRFELYDTRLGDGVASTRAFDRWWAEARQADPDRLTFTTEMLVNPQAAGVSATAYPDLWRVGDLTLRLSYEFAPGSETDGVTVQVPLPLLDRVRPGDFDWQVPGLREELVTALIRSLPKPLRRNVVPATDHARAFLERAGPADGPLLEVLARELSRVGGDHVPPDAWGLERVPDHLRMTFRVEDGDGRTVAVGKDLAGLQRRLRERTRAAIAAAAGSVEQSGLRAWTVGVLPRVVEADRAGNTVRGHPALVDEGETVAVRVFATEADQARAMPAGTRRLLLLTVPSPSRAVERVLTAEAGLALAAAPHAGVGELVADCTACAVDALVAGGGGPAWDEDGFAALQDHVRAGLGGAALDVAAGVARILVALDGVRARLRRLTADALVPAVTDVRRQLSGLVYPGFVAATGTARLADVARYLQAVERRLDRLPGDRGRDRDLMERVRAQELEYEALVAERGGPGAVPELDHVRWMLEELRVSFFAQALGTAYPVSEKRVLRELDRLFA